MLELVELLLSLKLDLPVSNVGLAVLEESGTLYEPITVPTRSVTSANLETTASAPLV